MLLRLTLLTAICLAKPTPQLVTGQTDVCSSFDFSTSTAESNGDCIRIPVGQLSTRAQDLSTISRLAKKSTCQDEYVVVKGDWCSTILAEHGYPISLQTLYKNNPAINSMCTNLMPEMVLCLDGDNAAGSCSVNYMVKAGDSCFAIAGRMGITLGQLYNLNPQIDSLCSNLEVSSTLCIRENSVATSTATTPLSIGISAVSPLSIGISAGSPLSIGISAIAPTSIGIAPAKPKKNPAPVVGSPSPASDNSIVYMGGKGSAPAPTPISVDVVTVYVTVFNSPNPVAPSSSVAPPPHSASTATVTVTITGSAPKSSAMIIIATPASPKSTPLATETITLAYSAPYSTPSATASPAASLTSTGSSNTASSSFSSMATPPASSKLGAASSNPGSTTSTGSTTGSSNLGSLPPSSASNLGSASTNFGSTNSNSTCPSNSTPDSDPKYRCDCISPPLYDFASNSCLECPASSPVYLADQNTCCPTSMPYFDLIADSCTAVYQYPCPADANAATSTSGACDCSSASNNYTFYDNVNNICTAQPDICPEGLYLFPNCDCSGNPLNLIVYDTTNNICVAGAPDACPSSIDTYPNCSCLANDPFGLTLYSLELNACVAPSTLEPVTPAV